MFKAAMTEGKSLVIPTEPKDVNRALSQCADHEENLEKLARAVKRIHDFEEFNALQLSSQE
eukprot:9269684-Pyramimonas_sp.AAC.1